MNNLTEFRARGHRRLAPRRLIFSTTDRSSEPDSTDSTEETAIMEAGSTRRPHPEQPEELSQEQLSPQANQTNPLAPSPADEPPAPSAQNRLELEEEQKLIRRLQMMMNMVMQVIAQDHTLSIEDAAQMIADSKKAALAMFPGKELAYDLIWKPRFQRLMRERFRIM